MMVAIEDFHYILYTLMLKQKIFLPKVVSWQDFLYLCSQLNYAEKKSKEIKIIET